MDTTNPLYNLATGEWSCCWSIEMYRLKFLFLWTIRFNDDNSRQKSVFSMDTMFYSCTCASLDKWKEKAPCSDNWLEPASVSRRLLSLIVPERRSTRRRRPSWSSDWLAVDLFLFLLYREKENTQNELLGTHTLNTHGDRDLTVDAYCSSLMVKNVCMSSSPGQMMTKEKCK